jgi:hypothetical protein
MSDRELLEMAAKAAGIEWYGYCGDDSTECHYFDIGPDEVVKWNPLRDDGDALRLAVKLEMNVEQDPGAVFVSTEKIDFCEHLIEDRVAATRRAIVRAAAEIGRKMP